MDENIEMLEYISKDCDMGIKSLTTLIRTINDKDNKITKVVEGILKGYENYLKESKKIIKKHKYEIKDNSKFAEISSWIGIKIDLLKDNSDASVADMLTKGLTMGVLNMEKNIKNYKEDIDSKIMKLAKEFLKFQQESIEFLKKYL
jgi:hypothetical protein